MIYEISNNVIYIIQALLKADVRTSEDNKKEDNNTKEEITFKYKVSNKDEEVSTLKKL